jgi:hypothetical protein
LRPWHDRPVEVRYMFNPAFIGETAHRFCRAYTSESKKDVAFAVLFVALPIVIFEDLRETIRPLSYSQLHVWVRDNPGVRLHLPVRARHLMPYVRESITLLLHSQRLTLEDGMVRAKTLRIRSPWKLSDPAMDIPVHDCLKKAETLGRWCGRVADEVSIFNMLGVRP